MREVAGRWLAPVAWVAMVLLPVVVTGSGCATERPFVWVQTLPLPAESTVIVGPRDTISVDVRNQAALSGDFVVGDGGDYRHPTLGTIHVDGKTPADIARLLEDQLKELVVKPEVSVSLVRSAPVRVNVVGEVKTPGVYDLVRGRSVVAALAAAGWFTEFADRDRVFVVRLDNGEQRIRFRTRELTAAEPHAARFRLRDGDVVVVE